MNKKFITKSIFKKPTVETIISTIGSKAKIGNKRGVNLLDIVQKLSQKRAEFASKKEDKESSGEGADDSSKKS